MVFPYALHILLLGGEDLSLKATVCGKNDIKAIDRAGICISLHPVCLQGDVLVGKWKNFPQRLDRAVLT